MKFNTCILLAFVAAFAVLFAIAQSSTLVAAISCAFTFGPIVAHANLPTRKAIVAGILSSGFWILIGMVSSSVFFLRYEIIDNRGISLYCSPWILAVPVVASIVGGYLGSVVIRKPNG